MLFCSLSRLSPWHLWQTLKSERGENKYTIYHTQPVYRASSHFLCKTSQLFEEKIFVCSTFVQRDDIPNGCSSRVANANPIFRLRFFSINWKCESTTQGDTDEKCEPTNWEIRDIANIYIKSEHISQTAWKDLWGNTFGGEDSCS